MTRKHLNTHVTGLEKAHDMLDGMLNVLEPALSNAEFTEFCQALDMLNKDTKALKNLKDIGTPLADLIDMGTNIDKVTAATKEDV